MRALGIGLVLVVAACGSTSNEAEDQPAAEPGAGLGGTRAGIGGAAGAGGATRAGTGGAGGTTRPTPGSGGTSAAGGAAGKMSDAGAGGGTPTEAGTIADGDGAIVTALGCPASQVPGTWKNVTPATMKLTGDFTDGPLTVGVDPARPNSIYVHAQHDGTWRSTDCGFTYTKVSTGKNADAQNTGSQWGSAIDPNPNRDPSTPPALYVNQGYGALGLWKSTDGGVDWTNVWDGNIYKADGVTNISADVGSDLAGPTCMSTANADHLIIFLHSYWGSGGNNGVFETTDGGGKWLAHPTPAFNFQPHSDLLSAVEGHVWWVSRCDVWPTGSFWHSTDSGQSWTQSIGDTSCGMGHSIAQFGSTYYTGSDYHDGVFKTTDLGATWKRLPAPGNKSGWVAATAKNVYACNGYSGDAPHILHAPLGNDTAWVDDGTPPGLGSCNANNPGVIFDGSHYVLLVPAPGSPATGMWRFVEP